MKNLSPLYQTHLQNHFAGGQYLLVSILIMLLQKNRWVRLEKLAESFPNPIHQRSRLKKLQIFLSGPQWDVKKIWFPLFKAWLDQEFNKNEVLYLAIERTQWGNVNLLMVSLIYQRRAIPIYWTLLEKLGNTNAEAQKLFLESVLELLKDYQKVFLGDREFCSVDLAKWLSYQNKTYFSLRLKKSTCIEVDNKIWGQLQTLGVIPGSSVYHQGVKVTKTKGFGPFNIAGKWKRTYRGFAVNDAWFVLSNLSSVEKSLNAYGRRMGIEEMFRDFKSGGYNQGRHSSERSTFRGFDFINSFGLFSRGFLERNSQI